MDPVMNLALSLATRKSLSRLKAIKNRAINARVFPGP